MVFQGKKFLSHFILQLKILHKYFNKDISSKREQ